MFVNIKKIMSINQLGSINALFYRRDVNDIYALAGLKKVHTTHVRPNYAAIAPLPLPNNIDPAETTRFSPNRARDISGTVILSQRAQSALPIIDITTDNSATVTSDGPINCGAVQRDPHLQSYDCFGAVSLNSVMQSNVPTPFGGMHKFSHLNMPGGQWSQEGKFMSNNLHSSHYTNLRKNVRSKWLAYDQDAVIDKQEYSATLAASTTGTGIATTTLASNAILTCNNRMHRQDKRNYCKKIDGEKPAKALSKRDQLKKAFKDYGSTVIVFHVAISLVSLGGCYLLVSGGIDVLPILEQLGLASTALSSKITAGASTFVIAYAIHKLFAPVRISITLGATPLIVRFMRSKGCMNRRKSKQ